MSLQQEQDLLARLYTDRDLRAQVLDGPRVSSTRTRELAKAAAEEVRWFAESLVTKRLREVEKLLPLTRQVIGSKIFERRFRLFADTFSPVYVKKHLEDALAFAKFLVRDPSMERAVRNVARFESSRLRHNSLARTISICPLVSDPRGEIGNKLYELRSGFGIWIAVGGWSRVFFRRSHGRSRSTG